MIWKIQWRFASLPKPPTDKQGGSYCLVNCLCGAVNVYDPKMLKYLFCWRSMRSNFPKWPFTIWVGEVLFLHHGSWKRVPPIYSFLPFGVIFHFHDCERKGIVSNLPWLFPQAAKGHREMLSSKITQQSGWEMFAWFWGDGFFDDSRKVHRSICIPLEAALYWPYSDQHVRNPAWKINVNSQFFKIFFRLNHLCPFVFPRRFKSQDYCFIANFILKVIKAL